MPAFSGEFVSLSGFIFSSSNTRLMLCWENATASQPKFSRRCSALRVHLFTLRTPLGADDDMVTKLGEKGATLRKMLVRNKHKHNVLTKRDIIFQENLMRESADADFFFRRIMTLTLTCIQCFFVSYAAESPQTSSEMVLLGCLCKTGLESVQEEDFLLPCAQKCFAPG